MTDPVQADRELAEDTIAGVQCVPRAPRREHGIPWVPLSPAGAAILSDEESVRRLSPRRSRWPQLADYDEQVRQIEEQIRAPTEQAARVNEQLIRVDDRDVQRHAQWLLNRDGPAPQPERPKLEEEQKRLQREIAGHRAAVSKLLEQRAQFVEKHRPKLAKDADSAAAAAAERYAEKLREAERARKEAAELRETAIWARLYHEARESDIQLPNAIAGGERKRLAATGMTLSLPAEKLFAALRQDAEWLQVAIPPSELAHRKLRDADKAPVSVWDNTEEGQRWRQDQRRQALERQAKARQVGTRWGD
jgi:hypothetical protein